MDYKAFVSSTFVDLKGHRAHVISELRKSGFFVDPMEEWASATQEPKVLSAKRLDGCKLCVLLVARRRGHVPAGDTLSITQQEVEVAQSRGIDVLPFLLEDGALWKTEWDELKTDKLLREWRAEIREGKYGTAASFSHSPDSVGITPALVRWVKEMREGERTQIALDLYFRQVEREHGMIQFVGLPQLKDNPNSPIDKLYVEPALSEMQVSPDIDPNEWPTTTHVLDVMAKESKLVVLGDPGSGKSTLVSWISWQLARHHQNGTGSWAERLGELVPLPFTLRNLNIGKGVSWETLLESFLNQPIATLLDLADLRRILDEGKAIIMLDGLDEIGNATVRQDLRDAVWAGFEKYPQCRWILTSRIVGYEEVSFDVRTYVDYSSSSFGWKTKRIASRSFVVPFDDIRVQEFAVKWFRLREALESKCRQKSDELVTAVRANESTRRLGRIPNLLTIMALVYRVRARLPYGRSLLYNEIAQAYLETIDYHRKIFIRCESLSEKTRWLARVAFEMQRARSTTTSRSLFGSRNETLAKRADVCKWVAAAMAESGKDESNEDATDFVDYLARRSGLLLPRGQEHFAFSHLSFQEFFAASFLCQKIVTPDWLRRNVERIPEGARHEDLERYSNDMLWHEVLIFLVELLAAEQPDWVVVARDCLFGENFSAISVPLPEAGNELIEGASLDASQNRVALLSRLAIDPQTGFDAPTRQLAIQACCRWEMAAQCQRNIWEHDNLIVRTLFAAEASERRYITEMIVKAAMVFDTRTINLGGTQLSDVSPLQHLTSLRQLGLNSTQVSDLSAISEMRLLAVLNISNTVISDVGPLRAMTGMASLDIRNTRVTDVSAVAGINGLTIHGSTRSAWPLEKVALREPGTWDSTCRR